VEIHRALGRLRRCTDRRQLLRHIPAELVRSCGFSRAMLSAVHGTRWAVPAQVWPTEIPLTTTMWETEMVRRRVPILVTDPTAGGRVFDGLLASTGATSYVAAPIAPSRQVIALLHADRFGQDRPVDSTDRDALWLFTENVGLLIERATLSERLDQERRVLNAMLEQAVAGLNALCEAGIELGDETPPAARAWGGPAITAAPRRDALLTDRERDVLDLVATGATNQEVAAGLSLSAETVKTHVAHVLRKLRASTRAEAVARYRSTSAPAP
jgi:DNA-binding CsgD family transcriptional regulator